MAEMSTRAPRASRRRRVLLGAATIGVLLPALVAGPGLAVDPTPASSPEPTASATPEPAPRSEVGGPRMAESGIVVSPGAPAVPATTAASWVLADADTGEVIAAKNPHGRYRPASTIKTLLALTMAPRLDPESTIVATREDEFQEGTRVGLVSPQAYKVDDLWYGLLLRSGNDAATALARGGGGTVAAGVEMMQREAERLQALDTTVVNPSGLDADGQFSSAYDLALWGRAALQRRDLRHYVSSLRHQFPGNHTATGTKKTRQPFWVYTENRLLLRGFPGAIGVKTGYTTKAQNTLIAAAERDGRTIVASLMFVPYGHITNEAGRLLEYGFANVDAVDPVGQLVDPISAAHVDSDAEAGFVGASTNSPLQVGEDGALSSTQDIDAEATAAARSDSLRWSAVAGSALIGLLVVFGAGRMVASRRRYRRYGAYRF